MPLALEVLPGNFDAISSHVNLGLSADRKRFSLQVYITAIEGHIFWGVNTSKDILIPDNNMAFVQLLLYKGATV